MVRYLDSQGGHLDAKTRDKLLFWFVQTGMWGLTCPPVVPRS
jgi:hypothetical protein